MNSSIDYSIALQDVLSTTIDAVSYEGLSPGETLSQDIIVLPPDESNQPLRTISTTYTADQRGMIVITGLARLFNGLILLSNTIQPDDNQIWNTVRVTFAFATATEQGMCNRIVHYSRETSRSDITTMLTVFPYLHRRFEVVKGRPLPVFFPILNSPNIEIGVATENNGDGEWRTLTIAYNPPPVFHAIDLMDAQGIENARYAILRMAINGTYTDTLRFDFVKQRSRASIFYRNFLGIIERIDAFGAEELSVERTAAFGYADNRYTALDLQCHDNHELYIGYAGEGTVDRVRDLLASPQVWIYKPDTDTYEAIVITEAEQSSIRPTATPDTFRINYRLQDESYRFSHLLVGDTTAGKIFSEPPFTGTFA